MNATSYCACRTAALRIFVRGFIGPLPPTLPTRSAASQASRAYRTASWTAAAQRQSRFQPAAAFSSAQTRITTTQAGRGRRRNHSSRQASTLTDAAARADNDAEHPGAYSPPPTATATVTPALSPSPPPVEVIETQTEDTPREGAENIVLGKNARKKLRRKKEDELRKAEQASTDVPVTNKTLEVEREEAVKKPKKQKRATRKHKEEKSGAEAANETAEKPSKKAAEKSKRKTAAVSSPSSKKDPSHPSAKPAEPWQVQKRALQAKFPEGWNPRKKLSPDALEGIRALHRQFPETYTTATLARHFQVSPEAIRRILKSSWQASAEEEEDRQNRWFDRGKQVWSRWAELGRKPPKRWQAEGIRRDPMSWPGGRRRIMEKQQHHTRQTRQAFQSRLSAEGARGREGGDNGRDDTSAVTQTTFGKFVEAHAPSSPETAPPQTHSRGRESRMQTGRRDSESKE
ncbi:Required for respiratory growth protein 9 mitochondrial [Sporothrix bragantina]|uniref:Required for respiratory growth protein 9, mitochondrial n=1 Tax=Sporothrix bragantina TaxID=671064 RepID=A0ABP0BBR2_9PEZI